ncbi:7 alpha-cephem-methoxylase, putative [Tolypocladium paradoxum]|uniref:7 alpha-cephem-methoxylase, putative n=1 Tax=Tolypocladium paradoxum TaxID=94208 RepID=A0A2S4KW23_9HYPO|nr:7 alpha-cephem-methoxylase, putative [Tolypocladium paradoxum]
MYIQGGRIDQLTKLQYFKWEDKFRKQKPYSLLMQAPDGFPSVNYTHESGPPETVEDVRGREHEFTLDQHGFALRVQDLPAIDFNGEHVEEEYFPLVRQLIRDECGLETEIVIFDWRLRSSGPRRTEHGAAEYVNLADPQLYLRPAVVAHVMRPDQTPNAARRRVLHHVPERGEDLLNSKRFRIINVWRPMASAVQDCPLACCDGSTVRPEDMVPVDTVRSSVVGESWQVMYRDYYRWYYVSKQTKNEALLIKMFDSDKARHGLTRRLESDCPHTSFKIDGVPASAPPRESIEVRALVFNHG